MKARRYPTDLSDEQWDLLCPLLVDDPHKWGRKYGGDMRSLVDALFYMAHTGCQWRYLPIPFPEWTLVWSQFRRWSRNDILARVLAELHAEARVRLGRPEALPSLLVLELANAEQARRAAAGLEDARRLLPAVIADATSVGMTLDVQLELDEWAALEVRVRYEPGGRYQRTSSSGLQPFPAENDADLLAFLADEVQEVSMERDQVNCVVWPVCAVHQFGGHADVEAGRAVWSCKGAGGHVIAPIGKLSDAR